MTTLGIEEGCPAEKPSDLEDIIAKPVAQAPIARPLPKAKPVSAADSSNAGLASVCEENEQHKFTACIQPLTAYQPHPIAVIKQPRLINEACEAFKKFNECRADLKCNPLWARGMSAMFAYACGPGLQRYTEVGSCMDRDMRGSYSDGEYPYRFVNAFDALPLDPISANALASSRRELRKKHANRPPDCSAAHFRLSPRNAEKRARTSFKNTFACSQPRSIPLAAWKTSSKVSAVRR